ncbi:hypothetical protein AB1Y20_014176 [Prymnesium parvum]|uniref:Uncharacterized protein n=1 Tax=Prymnesium parvum TaxID=97485 RepID=A0AB34ICY2_PRYPA
MIKDHCSIMSREPRSLHTSDASACRRWRSLASSSSRISSCTSLGITRAFSASCRLRSFIVGPAFDLLGAFFGGAGFLVGGLQGHQLPVIQFSPDREALARFMRCVAREIISHQLDVRRRQVPEVTRSALPPPPLPSPSGTKNPRVDKGRAEAAREVHVIDPNLYFGDDDAASSTPSSGDVVEIHKGLLDGTHDGALPAVLATPVIVPIGRGQSRLRKGRGGSSSQFVERQPTTVLTTVEPSFGDAATVTDDLVKVGGSGESLVAPQAGEPPHGAGTTADHAEGRAAWFDGKLE